MAGSNSAFAVSTYQAMKAQAPECQNNKEAQMGFFILCVLVLAIMLLSFFIGKLVARQGCSKRTVGVTSVTITCTTVTEEGVLSGVEVKAEDIAEATVPTATMRVTMMPTRKTECTTKTRTEVRGQKIKTVMKATSGTTESPTTGATASRTTEATGPTAQSVATTTEVTMQPTTTPTETTANPICWITTSSDRYHTKRNCRGLFLARHGVFDTTVLEAQMANKTQCRVCPR